MKINNPELIRGYIGDHDIMVIDLNLLYMDMYGELPNFHTDNSVNTDKFKDAFLKKFDKEIVDIKTHTIKSSPDKQNNNERKLYTDTLIIMTENRLMEIGSGQYVNFAFQGEYESHKEWLEFSLKYPAEKVTKKQTQISLILNGPQGLYTKDIKIKENKLNLSNYNEDFAAIDAYIKEVLNTDRIGVYLLYGSPGTGKTSYIRHLAGHSEKKLIVVSSIFLGALDSPEFTGLLLNNPNTILVIEDAERLLTSREDNQNSPISALLNLSDGLIGMAINLQIICTFNCPYTNIDKALTRKGRLIKSYEFKPLSIEKSQNLIKELSKTHTVTKEMSVAEIYNLEEEATTVEKPRRRIGFAKELV